MRPVVAVSHTHTCVSMWPLLLPAALQPSPGSSAPLAFPCEGSSPPSLLAGMPCPSARTRGKMGGGGGSESKPLARGCLRKIRPWGEEGTSTQPDSALGFAPACSAAHTLLVQLSMSRMPRPRSRRASSWASLSQRRRWTTECAHHCPTARASGSPRGGASAKVPVAPPPSVYLGVLGFGET